MKNSDIKPPSLKMYSRAGKASLHLYSSIFKDSSHISQTNRSLRETDIDEVLKQIELREEEHKKKIKDKKSNPTTAFSSVSRAKLEVIGSKNKLLFEPGHYSPSHEYLNKHSRSPKFRLSLPKHTRNYKEKALKSVHMSSTRSLTETKVSSLTVSIAHIPEFTDRELTTINFDHQLSRNPFVKADASPNENRFSYMPNSSGKNSAPNFSKMLDRGNCEKKTLKDIKYEYLSERLARRIDAWPIPVLTTKNSEIKPFKTVKKGKLNHKFTFPDISKTGKISVIQKLPSSYINQSKKIDENSQQQVVKVGIAKAINDVNDAHKRIKKFK